MRISCVSFARIIDEHGQYALLINRGKERKEGKLRLGPVGGGLQCSLAERRPLIDLGAHSFENELDLRFQVPNDRVNDVREWFAARTGRECSVLRELVEELHLEEGILDLESATSATEQFVGFGTMNDKPKPRHNMAPTLRLFEVYIVTMTSSAMDLLRRATTQPNQRLWFVTPGEILTRSKSNGRPKIAKTAIALVNATPQLTVL